MGGGLRAAVLATVSVSPVAPVAPLTSSKNGQNVTIRVTSELARSEDPFVRCAGCGVGEGCVAPIYAKQSLAQLLLKKHTFVWAGEGPDASQTHIQMPSSCLPDSSQKPAP